MVGRGPVLLLATGIVASLRTAAWVVGLAGSIALRGGVGRPAPRGAATTASGEAGVAFAPSVGAAGGAGGAAGRTVRTPRPGGGTGRPGGGKSGTKGPRKGGRERVKRWHLPVPRS